jgi:hypothetical protein
MPDGALAVTLTSFQNKPSNARQPIKGVTT